MEIGKLTVWVIGKKGLVRKLIYSIAPEVSAPLGMFAMISVIQAGILIRSHFAGLTAEAEDIMRRLPGRGCYG